MLIVIIVLFVIGIIVLFTTKPERWCSFCESINCVRSAFGDWCGREVKNPLTSGNDDGINPDSNNHHWNSTTSS